MLRSKFGQSQGKQHVEENRHPKSGEGRKYSFFYKQPHSPVEPRVAIESARNEAQNCYEVAIVLWRLRLK